MIRKKWKESCWKNRLFHFYIFNNILPYYAKTLKCKTITNSKNNMKKKILVWLSGWVDSAVSAYLLKEEGYDVTAWFMINYLAPEWEFCPTKDDIEEAKKVAKFLDIPFFTFDYRNEYEEKVLQYMYEWYKKWITPNPDIMCNSEIKFKVFLDEALELWYDSVATGHYARIEKKWEEYSLLKWIDEKKDQSYFLAWLNQKQLSKSMFPIWNLEKSKVRKIAKEIWLPNAERKDSQGICFVWKVDLTKFLEKKIEPKIWKIKDTSGKILGEHKGVYYYTIGQRKGLDLWGQEKPVFIVKKDIEKNEIIVWTEDDLKLYNDTLIMNHATFLSKNDFKFPIKAKAKIRYRQKDQKCEIKKIDSKNYEVKFEEKQRAIASGQICAIYLKDELIMSGIIK